MTKLNTLLALFGTLLALIVFTSSSGGVVVSRGSAYTGAPSTGGGTESTCNLCHASGASAYGEPVLDWTIMDGAGNNITSYVPGQTYSVTLAITTPMGAPAAYGFNAVFLDDTDAPNGATAQVAGTFSGLSTEMQTSSLNGRTYLEHNQRTTSGTWTFDWTAPAAGFGEVRIYSTGNAVNSNFSTGGDSGSSSPTIVALQEDSSMPVTLSAFTARAVKNNVTLDWRTELEENFSHFTVERSAAGGEFTPVTDVPAKSGNGASYSLTDANLHTGSYLYRLRANDLDGTFAYSNVLNVSVEADLLAAYPNPTNGPLTIPADESATYRLLDGSGRVVRANLQSGTTDVSTLTPGVYLLERTAETGRTVERIIKR